MQKKIAIVSLELDLHAHVVAAALRERFGCRVSVIAGDVCHRDSKAVVTSDNSSWITAYDGQPVSPSALDVVWWRRANQPQERTATLSDPVTWDLVSREWRFTIQDLFFSNFHGVWVNDPHSDILASCKSNQLRKAAEVGLAVPDTIITNDPDSVAAFLERHNGRIVVKKIAGTPLKPLATIEPSRNSLDPADVAICPAVYQQLIEAQLHLRVLALGDQMITVSIESDLLDWRRNLNSKMSEYTVEPRLREKIVKFLALLNLKMGVLDFILGKDGLAYFLEINPQGQFLFAEQRSGVPLGERCAAFLAQQ